MSLWDRLRGRAPTPAAAPDPAPPALPATPADGVITAFDVADAIGTIRLVAAAGDVDVRFGRSACGFEPAPGVAVRVTAVAVALGRVRATRVALRSDVATHEELLAERDRASGHPRQPDASGAGALRELKLAITTARPLSDRAALRAWWDASGATALGALRFDPSPAVVVDGHRFEVIFGSGVAEVADMLDLRFADGAPLGDGFFGLYDGVPELARLAGEPSLWGFGPRGNARALLSLIERVATTAPEVAGIVIGSAGATWLPAAAWLRRSRAVRDPDRFPVESFVDVAYGTAADDGVRRLRSFGMYRALGLPDVEMDDARADDDGSRHARCEHAAWIACRVLAGEDAQRASPPEVTLPVGRRVTIGSLAFRVLGPVAGDPQLWRLADVSDSDDDKSG